jgi:hypothetical protein
MLLIRPRLEFSQGGLVLFDVLATVWPKEFPSPFGVLSVESYRVEFMVSHDDLRSALFHHLARDIGGFDIGRSPVDEITHENGCAR